MSGWVPSTPVSMIPTRTRVLPGSGRYEPVGVASIICMSHCSPDRRTPVTGCGRCPSPWKLPRSDSTSRHDGFVDAPGTCPMAWLRAAPSSAVLASAFLAKLGSLDCTVATPTSVYSETIAACVADRLVGGAARAADRRPRTDRHWRRTPRSTTAPAIAPARQRTLHVLGPDLSSYECGRRDAGTYRPRLRLCRRYSDRTSGATSRYGPIGRAAPRRSARSPRRRRCRCPAGRQRRAAAVHPQVRDPHAPRHAGQSRRVTYGSMRRARGRERQPSRRAQASMTSRTRPSWSSPRPR